MPERLGLFAAGGARRLGAGRDDDEPAIGARSRATHALPDAPFVVRLSVGEGKMSKRFALPCLLLAAAAAFGCSALRGGARGARAGGAHAARPQNGRQAQPRPKASSGSPFLDRLSEAAVERTNHQVRYDPTYFVITYPNGDVPSEVGVCTDEVTRSYRALGVAL